MSEKSRQTLQRPSSMTDNAGGFENVGARNRCKARRDEGPTARGSYRSLATGAGGGDIGESAAGFRCITSDFVILAGLKESAGIKEPVPLRWTVLLLTRTVPWAVPAWIP